MRNRQRHAYRATLAGLLEAEGWALQVPEPEPCPQAAEALAEQLGKVAAAALAAEDAALLEAEPLSDQEAAELARRRQLEPSERAALARYRLAQRWALGAADPTPELLEADRDGLADRLRVALAPKLAALQALGLPALLQRFAAGETIASTDPAVVALHATATAHRSQLAAAAGQGPAAKPTGTLRALLRAVGWELERAGRIKARGAERDAYTYRAQRVALPAGVDPEALAAAWLEALRRPPVSTGAKSPPIENPCRGEKAPPLRRGHRHRRGSAGRRLLWWRSRGLLALRSHREALRRASADSPAGLKLFCVLSSREQGHA